VGNSLEAYEKERWIDRNFHHLLPVRKVLEVQQTEKNRAYSISNYIEGSNLFYLNQQELLDTIPAVLKVLDILESIDVSTKEGYGYFDEMGHGVYPTWLDFIKAVYNDNIYDWSDLEKKDWIPKW
jgi:hygromycin-B 4-O-kinase